MVVRRTAAGVDPGNAEQARAWDGPDGERWARDADRFDAALRAYRDDLVRACGVGPGDQVLDVGCGTGQTTRDAARAATSGSVLGVDLSAAMLAVARVRAAEEGLADVVFEQADAQVHPFAPVHDVVLSRTGAMFFADPLAAFVNLAGALRPGGRLVLLTWQPLSQNAWMGRVRTALAHGRELPLPLSDRPGPFGLADPGRIRRLLRAAGLVDVRVDPLRRPFHAGADVGDAERFLLGSFGGLLDGLGDDARAGALLALREDLAAHRTEDGVTYGSAAWLTRAWRASSP